MGDETGVDDVKEELATAIGLLALSDGTVHEAADRAGITRWELEETLENTDLADRLGIEMDADVAAEIDDILDDRT
jgi:hypothetical protein